MNLKKRLIYLSGFVVSIFVYVLILRVAFPLTNENVEQRQADIENFTNYIVPYFSPELNEKTQFTQINTVSTQSSELTYEREDIGIRTNDEFFDNLESDNPYVKVIKQAVELYSDDKILENAQLFWDDIVFLIDSREYAPIVDLLLEGVNIYTNQTNNIISPTNETKINFVADNQFKTDLLCEYLKSSLDMNSFIQKRDRLWSELSTTDDKLYLSKQSALAMLDYYIKGAESIDNINSFALYESLNMIDIVINAEKESDTIQKDLSFLLSRIYFYLSDYKYSKIYAQEAIDYGIEIDDYQIVLNSQFYLMMNYLSLGESYEAINSAKDLTEMITVYLPEETDMKNWMESTAISVMNASVYIDGISPEYLLCAGILFQEYTPGAAMDYLGEYIKISDSLTFTEKAKAVIKEIEGGL